MSELFTNDGTYNHLVDGPWQQTTFCGVATGTDPSPDDDPAELCWTCAFEWADRDLAFHARVSDIAIMAITLIDQLIADGQPGLAAEALADLEASDEDVFAEVSALRSRSQMVVAA